MKGVLVEKLYGPDWYEALEQYDVAVLPLGAASKEHGYHLPNQTDYLEAEAFKQAVVDRLPVLMLPTFGFGYYPAFVDWPGSLHLSPTTFRMVIGDVSDCLAEAGIRKMFLLDTGLSTRPVLEIVAREAQSRHNILVAIAAETGATAGRKLFSGDSGTHANDAETSLMLAIAPEQVDMSLAVHDSRPSTILARLDPAAPPAFVQGGRIRSESGVFGDPTVASREKGEAYFEAKINDLIEFLEAFIAM
jgi:creatinine amidohydrolase